MAVQKINITEFINSASAYLLLDVRSPAEYEHAHIPGAKSLPLFDNEQRAIVGTTYKKGQGIVRDQSHGFKSNNPFAGYQFVHAVDGVTNFGSIGRGMKNKGRIIYRAAENDQGKTKAAIMKVLDRTRAEFVNNLRKAA